MATGKAHRKRKAGSKAEKRKTAEQKKRGVLDQAKAQKQNPRAFAFQSANKAKAQHARSAEKEQRRLHAPMLEQSAAEPPPFVVLVQGPPQVGKSTLIRCLVKHYCRQTLGEVQGPVTVVAGKQRRITFVECPQDLNSMLDAAKMADLVLLLVDGSFGFEMETFEFLNLLQVHGFPKVMGVLTHLDGFSDQTVLKKAKKKLKARFWAEIYDGAKLFYLSGIQHGKYLKREVLNLARFISVMKSRPLAWRVAHPYVIADRFEDLTPRELVRSAPQCDREVVLYGYLRGTNMRHGQRVHWAGVGDFSVQELDALPDPCPLPGSQRKKGLNDKERLIYAPMSDLGGLLYDKDAVYIDIPNWKVQYSNASGPADTQAGGGGGGHELPPPATEGEAMVRSLQKASVTVDEALAASSIRLFQSGKLMPANGGDDQSDQSDDEMSDDVSDDVSGSDWSDDEAGDGSAPGDGRAAAARGLPRGLPQAKAVADGGGRVRRAALFADQSVEVEEASSEEEDDDDEGMMQGDGTGWGRPGASEGDDDDEEEEGDDDDDDEEEDSEGLGSAARWKSSLGRMLPAPSGIRDLAGWVYGTAAAVNMQPSGGQLQEQEEGSDGEDDEGDEGSDDDFFVLKSKKKAAAKVSDLTAIDGLDSSRPLYSQQGLTAAQLVLSEGGDTDEEGAAALQRLRGRFVTGDWQAAAARATARPGAEEGEEDDEEGGGGDDSDEVYGDFEDMETGQVFTGGDDVTHAAQKAIADAKAQELREAKAAKKAAFDRQYDSKGAGGTGDDEDEEGGAAGQEEEEGGAGKPGKPGAAKEQTYYDAVKAEMASRAAKSRAALDAMPAATRVALEGLRPGSYVRLRLSGVPCELVQHLDPRRPMLVGGLGQSEDKVGVMKMRFKRHRWFPKVLKTRDPLVFSCGWRRFQALPVYCVEDHNRRLRALKYTPEHMHCLAAVYGPLAPQNTGVVAIQSLSSTTKGWRVSGTGVVLELDAELRIMKKLKLVGSPSNISRHTAFVQGMFNSQLEASRFEGASVRSVSGIRGTIKKAVRPGGQLKLKEGTVRVTFEDKVLMSDIIFLRSWVTVDIPRFINPVTNLLEAPAAIVRQLKPLKKKKAQESDAGAALEQQQQPAAAGSGPASTSTAAQPGHKSAAPTSVLATKVLSGAQAGEQLDFMPSPRFDGSRPGYAFKLGPQGLGYYLDVGPGGAVEQARQPGGQTGPGHAGAAAGGGGGGGGGGQEDGSGWVGMRIVAALRREQGVGAPRVTDSLYHKIERAPRKFNPLHVPKSLQAALPFKTKPKLEPARTGSRKTLEQKRAVVMEAHERRAATLLQQLNALRNEKAEKRREQKARHAADRAKKADAEAAWRGALNKERRRERYVEQTKSQKRKEMASEGKGAAIAKKKARKAAAADR